MNQQKRDYWTTQEVPREDRVMKFLHSKAIQDKIASVLDMYTRCLREVEVRLLRWYCMCHLLYENIQRSGTIKNATLGEFNRRVDEEEHSVMFVKQHKMSEQFGSAKVVIPRDLLPALLK